LKRIKLLFIVLAIISVSIQSCGDSCENIGCDDFDAVCENGDCVCNDLTANYLIGTWLTDTTGNVTVTFNSDNTYTDGVGNESNWTLDSSTNTITIGTGIILIVKTEGFSCTQMNLTSDNGTTQTELRYTR